MHPVQFMELECLKEDNWSLTDFNYAKILTALSNKPVRTIVEFGSGLSTIRLSKDFPRAKILSIEHQELFHKRFKDFLRENNIDNVVPLCQPLKYVNIGIRRYLTYNLDSGNIDKRIDFVLVDGPVESKTLRGREAPLYMIFPLLRIGCIIALDDFHRASAKMVVKNWLSTYKKNLRVLREYRRIILLEKRDEQAKTGFPQFASIIDNWYTNIVLYFRDLKSVAKSTFQI